VVPNFDKFPQNFSRFFYDLLKHRRWNSSLISIAIHDGARTCPLSHLGCWSCEATPHVRLLQPLRVCNYVVDGGGRDVLSLCWALLSFLSRSAPMSNGRQPPPSGTGHIIIIVIDVGSGSSYSSRRHLCSSDTDSACRSYLVCRKPQSHLQCEIA